VSGGSCEFWGWEALNFALFALPGTADSDILKREIALVDPNFCL
jgi:hypothetical protein